jgi:quercetin dioxygenase-like cupin family protein
MKLISILAITVFALPCCAQNKAEVFSNQNVSSQLATLTQTAKASGSGGATLGDYKSHSIRLSVRAKSGGAELHAHFDDIFVVTDGKATLITGGTLIDEKNNKDGESTGSSIQGGSTQTIAKGDVVHIPAGTPHQIMIEPGTVYSSIVVKVREP